MIWTIISAIIVFCVGLWLGYKNHLHLDQITARTFLLFSTIVLALFLVLRFLHDIGIFPEAIAGAFMASLYAFVAGFLIGNSYSQYKSKSKMGEIEYVNRSFASDTLPNLIALTLIIAGIARTSLLNDLAITPIRFASGLSVIGLGFLGLTLRLTPEFRRKGIVLIDRHVLWKDFISYTWCEENVLEIEFLYNDVLTSYRTIIPMDERVKIEAVLKKKLIEKLEKESD